MTEAAAGQVRIAWLVVALAAVLGFASIVLPAQRRIAAIEERAAGLADLAARNEALLARLDSSSRRVRASGATSSVYRERSAAEGRPSPFCTFLKMKPAATILRLPASLRPAKSRQHLGRSVKTSPYRCAGAIAM